MRRAGNEKVIYNILEWQQREEEEGHDLRSYK